MGTKQNRISVDRAEHEALCHLRDVEHEAVKLRLLAAEQRYQECLAINRDAVSRLARQDLEINGLRREVDRLRASAPIDVATPLGDVRPTAPPAVAP